jgi:hypothetical protein
MTMVNGVFVQGWKFFVQEGVTVQSRPLLRRSFGIKDLAAFCRQVFEE